MKTRSGQLQCVALAAVLALGAGLAWAFLGAILMGALDTIFRPAFVYRQSDNLVFLRDGTPIIQSTESGNFPVITYRTLDGTRYDKPFSPAAARAHLQGPLSSRERFERTSWLQRIVQVAQPLNDAVWCFVHDGLLDGHGYFVGYDSKTRLRVGYIDRNGFCLDEPSSDERFAVDGRKVNAGRALCYLQHEERQPDLENTYVPPRTSGYFFYLLADDGLVLVNLGNRTAKVVLKDADIVSATAINDTAMNDTLTVRTSDSIRLMRLDGKEIRSYPLSTSLRKTADLELYELPNNEVLLYTRWSGNRVVWLDAAGKVIRQKYVTLRSYGQPRWMSQRTENVIASVAIIPSPGAILVGLGFDAWQRGDPQWFRTSWSEWWPGLLATAAISMVLAVCCYRRQRKYGLPWACVWAVFVLLFGVPAYLGYLAHRAWPVRLPCPHCGKLAPRDRPACFACGHAFPAPAPKGIEVFA